MKKKIKPEDLQLREELVNGSINPQGDATRNTCFPEKPLPEACDTTTTDPTFNGCTTIEEDKCNKSQLVCESDQCESVDCAGSRSLGPICCPLSDRKDCNNTQLCMDRPSIDVCFETEKNCATGNINCDMSDCCASINACEETWMCAEPISEDWDCEVPNE